MSPFLKIGTTINDSSSETGRKDFGAIITTKTIKKNKTIQEEQTYDFRTTHYSKLRAVKLKP